MTTPVSAAGQNLTGCSRREVALARPPPVVMLPSRGWGPRTRRQVMSGVYRRLTRLALPAAALLALANAGCLLAVAGVAAGAGGAAYVYNNGLIYRDYPANLADTVAAVR